MPQRQGGLLFSLREPSTPSMVEYTLPHGREAKGWVAALEKREGAASGLKQIHLLLFKCHFQTDDKEYLALLVLCISKVLQNILQI